MASKKGNSKFNLATQPSIPTRFRCIIGGEWKPLGEFSKSQQRFIQRQIDSRQRIDAANSGMACREHTSGQRTEMTCELCGLVKPLDEFSGATKRNGSANPADLLKHCKRCTAWVETQEPEVVPAPLETGHISIEEERGEMWPATFVDSTDFFADDLLPQAPVTGLSSLGLDDLDTSSIDMTALLSRRSGSSVSGGPSESGAALGRALPPHLRGDIAGSRSVSVTSATEESKNETASSGPSKLNKLPPHLRGLMQPPPVVDDASDCAVSSDYYYDPSSVSTATTAREAKAAKPRRVSFNAWDPKGIPYRGIKSVTASSAAGTSAGPVSDVGGEAQSPPKQPEGQSKGKWVRTKDIRMSQTELRQVGTNHHVAARQVGPAKHRPPQHNFDKFCEPDEDDEDF
ncbi:stc1 domain-containing [Trichoderma arundinaceum]|uniref:Stc1 domain-containing n=1 Tax=Trichoderma arundinaceum TaxID=490622 RepID=A0A395NEK6_TRIAR|nr:stc1 domain-containing [Trichoderma arundinaceum]